MTTPPGGEADQPSGHHRPGAVTAAGVILLVSAGLGILACGGLNYVARAADLPDQDRTLLTVFSAILVGISLLTAVLGYFVLQGRRWARATTIVICLLGIAGSVISFFTTYDPQAEGSSLLSSCVGILLNSLVIRLLSGSSASDYFRSAHR